MWSQSWSWISVILHSHYPLVLDKVVIKIEILSDYQFKIGDLSNIPIGNDKKLVSNFFDKEKYVIHYENVQLYLRLGLKLKKDRVLEFNQSQWLKQCVELRTQKRVKAEENGGKDGKTLYKLMNNGAYGKPMEKRNNKNFVSTKKDYLKGHLN